MKGYERNSWEGFSILFEGTSERSHAKAKHRILSFGSVGIGMAPFFGPPSFFWPSSGSCLLLLVNQSPHFTTESETKFTEGFSLAILGEIESTCRRVQDLPDLWCFELAQRQQSSMIDEENIRKHNKKTYITGCRAR